MIRAKGDGITTVVSQRIRDVAATACALAAGCPLDAVRRGLEAFSAVKGRSQLQRIGIAGREIMLMLESAPASVAVTLAKLLRYFGPYEYFREILIT